MSASPASVIDPADNYADLAVRTIDGAVASGFYQHPDHCLAKDSMRDQIQTPVLGLRTDHPDRQNDRLLIRWRSFGRVGDFASLMKRSIRVPRRAVRIQERVKC